MEKVKYLHEESVHNTKSAEIIVPEIIKLLKFDSVLDVGCGIGTWLHVFNQKGIKDFLGIDGDFLDRELLSKYISADQFKSVDLEKPFDLGRKFDLAISLEVAEHLNEASADNFVDSICRHADTVIFSAAIPGQGGQNHINEQWPSYWIKKFEDRGYLVYDMLRPIIWTSNEIEPWYKQNILVFSKNRLIVNQNHQFDIVHPQYWHQVNKNLENYERRLGRIKSGKVGFWFYFKSLIKSFKYLGINQKNEENC